MGISIKNKKRPAVLLLVVLLTLAGVWYYGRVNFFRNLDFDDIEEIRIYSTWHTDGKPSIATLSKADAAQVHDKLTEVRLHGFASREYMGYTSIRTMMYVIKLNNGKTLEFSASSPFYILDQEKGFRGDRLLCHELADLYARLDEEYFPRPGQ